MDKSYFIQRKAEIEEEIATWKQELKDLEEEYIESNQQFPVGSKVCIITPAHVETVIMTDEKRNIPEQKRYSYVVGYEICRNDIAYVLLQAKKDGKISKLRDYGPYQHETIELA